MKLSIINKQQEYYNKRAQEYDQWWFRQGKFDLGTQGNEKWRMQIQEAEQFFVSRLTQLKERKFLELAPGTGIWTNVLLDVKPEFLACIDGSAEMIQVATQKLCKHPNFSKVHFQQENIFEWHPIKEWHNYFDACFFGFFLSHIPPQHMDDFFKNVQLCLKEGGKLYFIDSFHIDAARRDKPTKNMTEERTLNDGTTWEIVKIYYSTKDLEERLRQYGFTGSVSSTETAFILGDFTLSSKKNVPN